METVARLGATHLSVVGADPDRARLADSLAALTRDAAPYGLVPTLEPITYQPVHSIPRAADLARAAGCAVLLDSLHVHRFGGTVDELRALERALVPHVQLCDAPLAEPHDLPRPRASRSVSPPTAVTSSWSHERCARCRGGRTAARRLPGRGAGGYAGGVEAPSVFLAERLGAREFAQAGARRGGRGAGRGRSAEAGSVG
ncbi:TIM barrel protein [Streptomyces sp. KL116D]|uniref:TIM barrel protein n=1 Tax=Streptomyces sp. KL116D TaxID=3045152 RepID=UPI003556F8DB